MCQFRDIFCNKKDLLKKVKFLRIFGGFGKGRKQKFFTPSPLWLLPCRPCRRVSFWAFILPFFARFRVGVGVCSGVLPSVRFWAVFVGVFGGRFVCGFVCASFEDKKRRRARVGCAVLRLMVCACGLGLFGFNRYF